MWSERNVLEGGGGGGGGEGGGGGDRDRERDIETERQRDRDRETSSHRVLVVGNQRDDARGRIPALEPICDINQISVESSRGVCVWGGGGGGAKETISPYMALTVTASSGGSPP